MPYIRTTILLISSMISPIAMGSHPASYLTDIYNSVRQLYMATDPIAQEMSMLLDTPNEISLRNYNIHNELYQILKSFERGETHLGKQYIAQRQEEDANNKMQEYVEEKQYPLSVFYECNDRTCPLSRQNHPSIRATFDKRVKERILQAAKTKNNEDPIRYVSVGSGGLLQDMRILGLALREKPDMHIDIHMIDPGFKHSSSMTQSIYQRALDVYKDIHNIPSEFSTWGRRQLRPIFSNSKPMYENKFQKHPISQPEYFLYVLRYMYPRATINVYLYEEAHQYHQFIKGIAVDKQVYRIQPPDVIATSDIETSGIIEEINKMIMDMLKQNKNATALYLLSLMKVTTLSEVSYTQIIDGQQRKYATFLAHITVDEPRRVQNRLETNLSELADTKVWSYIEKPLTSTQ